MCPRASGIHQLSRATEARVRRPTGSTSCPGRLKTGSKVLRGRPALPGYLRLGPMARGVVQISGVIAPMPKGPRGRPDVPGDLCPVQSAPGLPAVPCESGPGPRARGEDRQSRVTRARVPVPAVSPRCLGRLENSSEGPRVDQHFRVTQARAREPTISTSISGDSGPCLRCRSVE